VVNHNKYNYLKCDWCITVYFALTNLKSFNGTVYLDSCCNSSPINPPITSLITFTIVTNSRDLCCNSVDVNDYVKLFSNEAFAFVGNCNGY